MRGHAQRRAWLFMDYREPKAVAGAAVAARALAPVKPDITGASATRRYRLKQAPAALSVKT